MKVHKEFLKKGKIQLLHEINELYVKMIKGEPLVSIIVACYNAEKYVDICMQSLISQSYKNIEIVVCDDASTDQSMELLNKWKDRDRRIIVLKNENNMFAAATRDKCFEVSKGDFFMIQDIDDASHENRVERLLEILQKEEGKVDFVSSSMMAFKENPKDVFRIMSNRHEYPTRYHFLWNQPFFNPATMFRRECIEKVGGYRVAPETRRGQDYDMFMRMYAVGFKGKNIFEPLYYFRLDADNIKRRTFEGRIGEYKIRKSGFKAMGLMPWAFPFLLKPFIAHIVQKIKYR